MTELSHYCQCDTPLYWTGCYTQDARLKKLLDPKTTRHPAKMAPGLLSRIFDHLTATGLLSPGTTIVHFMGGTGRTAVEATRRGYRAVTVELEPHFVEFQKLNKAATEKALGRKVDWDIRQGDARKLSEILSGGAGIVSPPYANRFDAGNERQRRREGTLQHEMGLGGYSENADNIGNLKAGVVSPPYAGGLGEGSAPGGEKWAREKHIYNGNGERSYRSDVKERNPAQIGNLKAGVVSPPYGPIEIGKGLNTKPPRPGYNDQSGRSATAPSQTDTRYSTDPDNIGNLPEGSMAAVVSPPYGQSEGTLHPSKFKDPEKFFAIQNERIRSGIAGGHAKSLEAQMRYVEKQGDGYESQHPDNIANLAAVTSPPYMGAQTGGGIAKNGNDGPPGKDEVQNRTYMAENHGSTEGQLGAQKPPTYWEAMRTVYTEAFRCGISPLVIVTKDPTRNKAIVPLGARTAHLIEEIGYQIVDYHRAVLFEERKQATLDGDVKKSVSGRVSFFKRLSIAKGSPAARWEDVLVAVIPEGS